MDGKIVEQIRYDAACLAADCLHSEKAHFIYAVFLRRLSSGLGIGSAVLAAIAGFGGIADLLGAAAVGWIALAATVLTALNTAAKPGEAASSHQARGVAFNDLRVRLRQFVHIDAAKKDADPDVLRTKLEKLTREKSTIAGEQPPTPSGRWYQSAKKVIASGEADYERHELMAAVGDMIERPTTDVRTP